MIFAFQVISDHLKRPILALAGSMFGGAQWLALGESPD